MPTDPALDIFKDNEAQNLTSGSSFTPLNTNPYGQAAQAMPSSSSSSSMPDQKNLEMAYLFSGINPQGPNPMIGKMVELGRVQRATESIAVAMDNAQEAINQHDYGKAKKIYLDAIKAASLTSPEMLKHLVPQFQAIQTQDFQNQAKMAVLNNVSQRIANMSEGTTPAQKRQKAELLLQQLTSNATLGPANGLTPELVEKIVQGQLPESRPDLAHGGNIKTGPLISPAFESYGMQLSEDSFSKEAVTALGSKYNATVPELINGIRDKNPFAIAAAKDVLGKGAHANLVNQIGVQNLAPVEQMYGSAENVMYGQGGQQQAPQQQGQQQAPQGPVQGPTQPPIQRPNMQQLQKQSQTPPPNLWPSGQPNPAYTQGPQATQGIPPQVAGSMTPGSAPSDAQGNIIPPSQPTTIQGIIAADTAKAKAIEEKRIEQTTPPAHPESQPALDATTGELIPHVVPLNTPGIVRVDAKTADKAKSAGDVLAKIDTFEATVKDVAQKTGWTGPINALKHFITNTPWLPGRAEAWQQLTQAHQDMDRAWQNFEQTTGVKSSETGSVRKSLNSFSTTLSMEEQGIAAMRESVLRTRKSLVGNQEQVPKTSTPLAPQKPDETDVPKVKWKVIRTR